MEATGWTAAANVITLMNVSMASFTKAAKLFVQNLTFVTQATRKWIAFARCSAAYRHMLDSRRRVFPCLSSAVTLIHKHQLCFVQAYVRCISIFLGFGSTIIYSCNLVPQRRLKIIKGRNCKPKRVILIYVRELHWRLPGHQLLCQFSHVPSIITTFSPNKNIGRFWYQLWNHKVQTLIVMKDVPLKYVWSR